MVSGAAVGKSLPPTGHLAFGKFYGMHGPGRIPPSGVGIEPNGAHCFRLTQQLLDLFLAHSQFDGIFPWS